MPGQLNTFDAYAFRVLADAQAAINDFKASVTSGKVTETQAVKAGVNDAINAYNAANVAYQAWHAAGGTGPTTPVTQQLNSLQAAINNVAVQVQGGGK